jgi:FkbH-like protein
MFMKLINALKELRQVSAGATPFNICLACGFTPLHLQTFLAAHLQQQLGPSRRVAVRVGLYGDALGNIERVRGTAQDVCVVALEWSDLEPRLGIRHLGGWRPRDLPDIAKNVDNQATRFERAIEAISGDTSTVICLPTLPLPPVSYLPSHQLGSFEADLRARLGSAATRVSLVRNTKVLNPHHLDMLSPLAQRLDVKSELSTGFPYWMAHADVLAELLARLVLPPAPKKGLITDLDDTFWRGVLGDAGAAGVSWDLDGRSHMHGLYQQMLCSLAEAGVLIAVASKNTPSLVDEVFRREDLILTRKYLFPLEISWGPKSEAVGRILQSWNIGPESVVFVDDSPMELAEVQSIYPQIECLLFPKDSDPEIYELISRLRSLFGRATVSAEDAIRLESLRQAGPTPSGDKPPGALSWEFLVQSDAELMVEFVTGTPPARALELINKTNQFNLNGRRYTDGEWLAYLRRPGAFLLLASYRDKYGPLGMIAVLAGCAGSEIPRVDIWVMSCRAFSRRIEHRCINELFDRFAAEEIAFEFQATSRNGPLREFCGHLLGGEPTSGFRVSRATFEDLCPPLHHRIIRKTHGQDRPD